MPRDGSNVYSAPAGTKGSPGTTIESAKYNALVDDLVSDANAARPVTAGGTGETSARLKDGTWRFQNTADTTKLLAFDVSGVTTGTTRTLAVPNASGTLPLLESAQTWTAAQTFSAAVTVNGAFTSVGIDDNATGERLQIADTVSTFGTAGAGYALNTAAADQSLTVVGGSATSSSANIVLYGGSHATLANDFYIRSNTTNWFVYDASASSLSITNSTEFLVGKTTGDSGATAGLEVDATGVTWTTASGAPALVVNRLQDGDVVWLRSAGTTEGAISIAGTTVTYGTFTGAHWSQMQDGSRPDILPGTIVDTVDDMSAWVHLEYTDETGTKRIVEDAPFGAVAGQTVPYTTDDGKTIDARVVAERKDYLARFKVSDAPGSTAVYGVFLNWDPDYQTTNDANIASLGTLYVRMAPGVAPKRGDLIESNGDGTGRVQDDDLMRASTVAKITSGNAIKAYPDGSKLYPCTLHCG